MIPLGYDRLLEYAEVKYLQVWTFGPPLPTTDNSAHLCILSVKPPIRLGLGLVQGQEILDDKDLLRLYLVLDDWRSKKFQEMSTLYQPKIQENFG